jgi:CHAD domain-containing protein
MQTLIDDAREAAARVARLTPRSDDDPEAIHDLRVAIRRLRTVLRPLRPLYGRRRMRAIGSDLKEVADATGSLRDEEVLRETLTALELPPETREVLTAWMAGRFRREQAQRAAVVRELGRSAVRAAKHHHAVGGADGPSHAELLTQSLERLGHRIHHTKRTAIALGELRSAAIASAHAEIAEWANVHPSDTLGMHALRIRWKRLRYSAELFAEPEAEDSAERAHLTEMAKQAARMQKRLGEVHDFDQAILRLRRAWGLEPGARHVVVAALISAREKSAERASRDVAALLASWSNTVIA